MFSAPIILHHIEKLSSFIITGCHYVQQRSTLISRETCKYSQHTTRSKYWYGHIQAASMDMDEGPDPILPKALEHVQEVNTMEISWQW